ncbi:MAG: DUF4149 domain-containing protein [Gemmatimonadaceae bacterium]
MTRRTVPLLWLWLGAAILFVTAVAPAAFAVLPTRAMAGLVVGRILPVLFWSGAIVGILVFATTAGWRRIAAALLVLSSLGAQLGVAPRIERIRAALGPSIEDVPAEDVRRIEFGRLHGLSVMLLGVGMLGAASVAVGGMLRPSVSLRSASGAPLTFPSSQ